MAQYVKGHRKRMALQKVSSGLEKCLVGSLQEPPLPFALSQKVGLYCSDVSGAFDKVSAERLVAKLRSSGIHEGVVRVIESWLRQRTANVIVGGAASSTIRMNNMVYQGTVLGPPLWNIFFKDARSAIRAHRFTEIVYADDLNAFRAYSILF